MRPVARRMTVDVRRRFFAQIHNIGSRVPLRPCESEETVELFLAVFEMHRNRTDGVITGENITHNEIDIISEHFLNCVSSLYYPQLSITRAHPFLHKKLLSGVAAFRLEVFPVLLQHVPPVEKARCFRKCLRFLHDWEERLLGEVRSNARFEISKFGKEQAPVGSHALYVHNWWHGKFDVATDIEDNYYLAD